ncbi:MULTISPECIES: glutamate 5-kinase [unclassified Streptococcus]|uniref:glutamate 5-kinase n=1 Tax=unclassified Streptococcus TaxID=2608887 RepID=UPI001071C4E5|nr:MULTISPECIES: glutamate 5-kinase [unclassified Streptococcus]MBF0806086.1 glutamate 5-kinase [Streptococcus sp. 19428wA2_WM07]TFU28333.1 glutamate 5-kinase [Streptococcus sp. WM07]
MAEKTIVFKVGTSSLTQENGNLDRIKIARITNQLAQLHQQGHHIVLVTSGSIAAGFRRLGFDKRPIKIAEKQASAAVGQGLLIEEYTQNLMKDGIVTAQILLTQDDFADARRYQNASQALQVLLKQRAIPIINENDTIAIEEIKVGDNDTLSAQVASLLKADLLVLLTDVDGLYTANPNQDLNAKHLPVIESIDEELFTMAAGAGSSNATGGMTTKLQAAQIATKSGVPVFICSSKEDTALLEAVTQENRGTYFLENSHAMNQRKQWLAFYARVDALVEVDPGAVEALLYRGRSLLAAGVVQVEGEFEVGQVVEVYSHESHQLIGKGRVRLSSADLEQALQEGKAEGLLIHRNDWVTL